MGLRLNHQHIVEFQDHVHHHRGAYTYQMIRPVQFHHRSSTSHHSSLAHIHAEFGYWAIRAFAYKVPAGIPRVVVVAVEDCGS